MGKRRDDYYKNICYNAIDKRYALRNIPGAVLFWSLFAMFAGSLLSSRLRFYGEVYHFIMQGREHVIEHRDN